MQNNVMDTYMGLHSILGRLVENRVHAIKGKTQRRNVANMMGKLSEGFQFAKVSKLADIQLKQNREIMMHQMRMKMETKMMHKRLSIQLGHQEMQRINELKLQVRESDVERKILGLSPRRSIK